MNQMNNTSVPPTAGKKPARNPYTLWFVVLSFVAPVALAYFMFYFVDVSSFNNHGELLKPVVHASALNLKDKDGKPVDDKDLAYKWRFISFVNSSCDENCKKRLIETRQAHKTFGKNQHRILQVVVELSPADDALVQFIGSELPDAIILSADAADVSAALANAKLADNEIYIQDPMGYIMMRFSQQQPIQELQFDIKKLLKASQIG
ncbi:MAG: SCO family protein [Gammaproteobacteria bacterium]